jgi:hypothetical protein
MGEAPLRPVIVWKLARTPRMIMKGGHVASGYAPGARIATAPWAKLAKNGVYVGCAQYKLHVHVNLAASNRDWSTSRPPAPERSTVSRQAASLAVH